MFRVVIDGGSSSGRRYNLKDGVTVSLGSGDEDDLQVESSFVAEAHLQITPEGHTVHIKVREGGAPILFEGEEGVSFTLNSGDDIEVNGLTLKFAYVVFSLGDGKRRTSRMQHLTTLAVGALLVLEIGFIVAFSLIKGSREGLPATSTPGAEPAPLAPVPPPDVGTSQPALFFESVDSLVESDNQNVFNILQVAMKIGVRRDLSAGEEGSVTLKNVWEVEGQEGSWGAFGAFSPPETRVLSGADLSTPQILTGLLPRNTGPEGRALLEKRIRVRMELLLGGTVIDQRVVSFAALSQSE